MYNLLVNTSIRIIQKDILYYSVQKYFLCTARAIVSFQNTIILQNVHIEMTILDTKCYICIWKSFSDYVSHMDMHVIACGNTIEVK